MGSFGCTITSASCLIIPNSVRKLNKSKCHKTCTKHLLVEMCYWLLWWYANLFVRITICHVPGNWWYEHENMLMLYSSPIRGEFQTKDTISNHNLIITYHHCGLNVWHTTLCAQHVKWKLSSCIIASSIHLPWLCMFFSANRHHQQSHQLFLERVYPEHWWILYFYVFPPQKKEQEYPNPLH